MVKRPPPVTPEGFLATQDLKERGWTARLIRDFLGPHDAERPNGLKMGRRRLPPVKLYLEERAAEAEREEDFLVAQGRAMEARERAERAGRTRRANREQLLATLIAEWRPVIRVQPIRKGAVRKAREAHERLLKAELNRLEREAGPLKAPDLHFVKRELAFRLDAALASAYSWFPVPKTQEAPPVARFGGRDDDWD